MSGYPLHESQSLSALVKPAEAMAELQISRTKLEALIRSGELPSLRIGAARRIPRRALEQFVEQRLAAAAEQ